MTHDILRDHIKIVEKEQFELIDKLIRDADGIGGLLGSVTGKNGHYEVESVILDQDFNFVEKHGDYDDNGAIVCHLDYPSFEVDVHYLDLPFDERQQILELVIAEMQRLSYDIY